jgi:hypothetical protein
MKLGLQMGLESGQYCKRLFRWMFTASGVIGDPINISCLPPEKSARPHISFKEMNVQHLNEEIFYPAKPDWKPINVTVFDLHKNIQRGIAGSSGSANRLTLTDHPVYNWMQQFYDPRTGNILEPNSVKNVYNGFIKECSLQLFDGCGNVVESWIYEDCWPQTINFQTLDMSQSGIVMCDLTLRYARAYIEA